MKITGNTVGTTTPRANYNQTDPSKADYIVGRENIASKADEPLIVTGNFPQSWYSSERGASGPLANGTNLSHTLDEMCTAFKEGRDVYIRLTNTEYNYNFGNWNLHYVELQVSNAEDNAPAPGWYNLSAFGLGCAYDSLGRIETTPMYVNASMSSTPMLSTPIKTDPPKDTSPLIVTGSPQCKAIQNSGETYVQYLAPLLSHTAQEIFEAFNAGKEVCIRLCKSGMPGSTFGDTSFPEIQYLDAVVHYADGNNDSGYYSFSAHGTGWCAGVGKMYTVHITGSTMFVDYILVAAYLFESTDISSKKMVVTGSSAASTSDVLTSVPNSYVLYYAKLSRPASEIAKAYKQGQDVYIRLSDASGTIGNTGLPGITSIEARVNTVMEDATLFGGSCIMATGEGNCSIPAQYYRLTISAQDNQDKAMVYAYLYNSAGMS
jgi:hypothetical protein